MRQTFICRKTEIKHAKPKLMKSKNIYPRKSDNTQNDGVCSGWEILIFWYNAHIQCNKEFMFEYQKRINKYRTKSCTDFSYLISKMATIFPIIDKIIIILYLRYLDTIKIDILTFYFNGNLHTKMKKSIFL